MQSSYYETLRKKTELCNAYMSRAEYAYVENGKLHCKEEWEYLEKAAKLRKELADLSESDEKDHQLAKYDEIMAMVHEIRMSCDAPYRIAYRAEHPDEKLFDPYDEIAAVDSERAADIYDAAYDQDQAAPQDSENASTDHDDVNACMAAEADAAEDHHDLTKAAASRTKTAAGRNILQPLGSKDLVHVYDSPAFLSISDLIRRRIYGTYLVGGSIGTGKSSIINTAIAAAQSKDPAAGLALPVFVSFSDDDKVVDDFPVIVLGALIGAIEAHIRLADYGEEHGDHLQVYLTYCKERLAYQVVTENTYLVSKSDTDQAEASTRTSASAGAGISLNPVLGILGLNAGLKGEASNNNENSSRSKDESESSVKVTRTARERSIWQLIRTGIDLLSRHCVIFVYDGLDHSQESILPDLFKHHKEALESRDYFSFLLVNDRSYYKYGRNDLLSNPLYTHFVSTFYIGLYDFRQTVRFAKMMFGETSIIKAYELYYHSLGNLRMINSHYHLMREHNALALFKAILLKELVSLKSVAILDSGRRDILVKRYRRCVKAVFEQQLIDLKALPERMNAEDGQYILWPDYRQIFIYLIDILTTMDPELVKKLSDDRYYVDLGKIVADNEKLCMTYLKSRPLSRPEDWESIQPEDMFAGFDPEAVKSKMASPLVIRQDLSIRSLDQVNSRIYLRTMKDLVMTHLDAQAMELFYTSDAKGQLISALVIQNEGRQKAYVARLDEGPDTHSNTLAGLAKLQSLYGLRITERGDIAAFI